jgi:hypothetical protein
MMGKAGTRYLGRVVIEAWEPGRPDENGIVFMVQGLGDNLDIDGAEAFARDVVTRLYKSFRPKD